MAELKMVEFENENRERVNPRSPPRLRISGAGNLEMSCEKGWIAVEAKLCFPWMGIREQISLRDEKGDELALIKHIDLLDSDSKRALKQALLESGFVIEIIAIDSVEEEFELRHWSVETRHGPRRFQTPLDEWPDQLPGSSSLMIRDISGDLYVIRDPTRFDEKSRRILWAFVD